jgi:hypothetical protein
VSHQLNSHALAGFGRGLPEVPRAAGSAHKAPVFRAPAARAIYTALKEAGFRLPESRLIVQA